MGKRKQEMCAHCGKHPTVAGTRVCSEDCFYANIYWENEKEVEIFRRIQKHLKKKGKRNG